MLPPKKSKLAREALDIEEPQNGESGNGHAEQDPAPVVEEEKVVDIFKEELLDGKRKRELPPSEKFAQSWVLDNFAGADEGEPNVRSIYENHYGEACADSNALLIPWQSFLKVLRKEFPKGFSVKEDSRYHGIIKLKKSKAAKAEEKEAKEKKPKDEKTDGKTEYQTLTEICKEAINEFKNPSKGVMFNRILKYVASKFPALRIDMRPKFLLRVLEKEVENGVLELYDGIGRCGKYRLPGDSMEPEKPKKKKEPKEKEAKEGEEKSEGEDKEMEGEASEKDGEKSDDKEKSSEEDGEKDKEKEDKGEEKKSKKKTKKRRAPRDLDDPSFGWAKKQKGGSRGLVHSVPQRIEDTFPLAMVFMTEPKQASVKKIAKYLSRHYDVNDADNEVKKCLTKGMEKGYFDLVRGSLSNGTVELTVDEYDPSYDDNVTGMVINAVVACSEPKMCSVHKIKEYVTDYWPDFKVADKPYLYKKAIIRAENVGSIIRESGIGCSGTVSLAETFEPSPRVLQGEDDDEDAEEDYKSSGKLKGAVSSQGAVSVDDFKDAYVPRPSKRGHGRKAAAGLDVFSPDSYIPVETTRQSQQPTKKGRNDFSVDDFQDAYRPTASRSRGGPGASRAPVKAKSRPQPKKPKYKDDSEEEQEEEAPKPKKATAKKAKTPAKKSTPASKRKFKEEEEEEEEEEVEAPPPKKSTPKKTPAKKVEEEEEEEEEEVEAPPPKKSTPKKTPAKKVAASTPSRSAKKASYKEESDEEEEGEEEPAAAPAKSRGKKAAPKKTATPGRGTPARAGRGGAKPKYTDDAADASDEGGVNESESEEEAPAKSKKSPAKSKRKGRK